MFNMDMALRVNVKSGADIIGCFVYTEVLVGISTPAGTCGDKTILLQNTNGYNVEDQTKRCKWMAKCVRNGVKKKKKKKDVSFRVQGEISSEATIDS